MVPDIQTAIRVIFFYSLQMKYFLHRDRVKSTEKLILLSWGGPHVFISLKMWPAFAKQRLLH